MLHAQLALLRGEPFERQRRKLRLLVQLIERSKKSVIYSDLTEEVGASTEIELPGTGGTVDSGEFAKAGSFGLFIRSLVGLDRSAATALFAAFLDTKRYSKNQIEFVNLIINERTDRGVVDAARGLRDPYDNLAPQGPEAIFVEADLDKLFATLQTLTVAAG